MYTKASTGLTFTGHDESRCIDDDRLTRALTQNMEVAIRDDPLTYAVTHDGETYDVDVDTGVCGCGDYVHRGDDVVCKHVVRAALTHAFRGVRNPALVARVLARTEELGCVHDVRGCAGPTTLGARGIPCEGCIDVTPGHWSMWCLLHGRDCDVDAELNHAGPVALADGGEDETETIVDANGDRVPARSETADFGGGESTGVDEL